MKILKRSLNLAAIATGACLLPAASWGATLAVIDSGVDNEHMDFASRMWTNPGETEGNNVDDDGNGFVDDFWGWNFAEQNNLIIDRSYLGSFSPVPYRFFELQEKALLGTISDEELEEIQEILGQPRNIREIQAFGNFVHGTHVTGIAAEKAENGTFMALKIIPTEIKLPFLKIAAEQGYQLPLPADWQDNIREFVLKQLLGLLARSQGLVMDQVGAYLAQTAPDIANGSFGVSSASVQPILQVLTRLALGRPATEEELAEYTAFFLDGVLQAQRGLVDQAPNTLFVFAAGNDATDNDTFAISPANIKADNTLSVAATIGDQQLAPFSNFGLTMVEIAAPGTAIVSAIPGNESISLSGTSQAAPYVAGIATAVKDVNPELTPAQIKRILVETVETFDFLENMVKSGGIVHKDRALLAAEESINSDLPTAIEAAFAAIPQGSGLPDSALRPLSPNAAQHVFALPLPSPLQ